MPPGLADRGVIFSFPVEMLRRGKPLDVAFSDGSIGFSAPSLLDGMPL